MPCIFSEDEPNSPEVEVLQAGLNAVVFDGDSPSSLAESILRLHQERDDWLRTGFNFCDQVRENYSIERMTAQFATFFRGSSQQETSPC
jgi:glycosyltransferase involved in cell wall biosynthesis